MPVTLMPLPYAEDALSPHISADTLAVHHGKHHKTYVDKTNAAIEGTELADKPLEEIVKASRGNPKLFNNAAQVWNHGFYWMSMTPNGAKPSGDLAAAIDAYGGMDKLAADIADKGANHFASGWVWLVADGGKLAVEDTHDAETLGDLGADSAKTPLLVIDVWEHAYYLDRKNVRPDYLKAVLDNLLNWDFAAQQMGGQRWVYPA
jgi:Fe-Mn family superoxide dismutase